MSKLIDSLTRLMKGENQSIGFRTRQAADEKPRIQIIVKTSGDIPEGADAVISTGPAPDAAAVPAGIYNTTGKKAKTKADFTVYPSTASPVTADDDESGRVLEVDSSIEEGLLRAANELPVDAVLVNGTGEPLSWQALLKYKRFADLLNIPLLVTVSPGTTAKELHALWCAGVVAAVIGLDEKQPADLVTSLKAEMDKLDFSKGVKPVRHDAVLPGFAGKASRADVPDEEDDDSY